MRKKILITGASGLVGSRLVDLWREEFDLITPGYEEGFDITDYKKVRQVFRDSKIDFVLHLAAYTAVDKAEEERDICYKINVEGTRNVFKACQSLGIRMIYISTVFVFPGLMSENPYTPESIPNPLGFYAKTKWAGEEIVKDQAMIVRIDYPYRLDNFERKDIYRLIKNLLEKKVRIKAVEDMFFTPTFIDDLARALNFLIKNFKPRIYHAVGRRSYRPVEFFSLIADKFGFDKDLIEGISFQEFYKGKAARPQYGKIKVSEELAGFMRDFKQVLEEVER